MNLDYPYNFDHRGLTADTDEGDHIRDLVRQVLFTAPGERVNRPDFGSGLLQLTFEPNSSELTSTTEMLVLGALQQWLGDRILVESVTVENHGARLTVSIDYVVRTTQRRRSATFPLEGGSQ